MVDIKKALSERNVTWSDTGSNCKTGNIVIHCPLCGPDDPSMHMGIELKTGWWGCWRSTKHRGKNLARLFKLLGIPYVDIKSDILKKLLNRNLFSNDIKIQELKEVVKITKLPEEFTPIGDGSIFDKVYYNYLIKRGFKNNLEKLISTYQLSKTFSGKWSNRLLIPIFIEDEVSWTGRAVGNNELRYLSPLDTEARNIKECIFNYNTLITHTGRALIITEGPLDAIAADWYTDSDIKTTCLFGLNFSETQIKLLKNICPNFGTILLGLDQGTLVQSLDLISYLREYNPIIMKLPKKDLGEMSGPEINKLVESYLNVN